MSIVFKLLIVASSVIVGWLLSSLFKPKWRNVVAVLAGAVSILGTVLYPDHGKPECPHEWPMTLQVPGSITSIPEYHDCQRFVVIKGGALVYDSLQAVFVREQLSAVYANPSIGVIVPTAATTPPPSGSAPAGSNIAGPVRTNVPATQVVIPTMGTVLTGMNLGGDARLLTIGVVYSEGPYPDLGITTQTYHGTTTQTYHCIVLLWTGGVANAVYKAWMVPVPDEGTCLDANKLPYGSGYPLYVDVVVPGVGDVVPSVARWDWDPVTKTQFIGMKCPTGWCELHGQPFHGTSPAYAATADLTGATGQVARVKGWYDEQLLASTAGWKAGIDGVRGTLFPVPELGDRKNVAAYNNQWLPVAWVSLDTVSASYKQKANFGSFVPGAGANGSSIPGVGLAGKRNEIALCFAPLVQGVCADDSGQALRPDGSGRLKVPCSTDSKNEGTWYGRITASDGQVKYVCVVYRPTKDNSQPPGVVRWRWSVRDDLVWISCPLGCCEVEVDDKSIAS